MYARHFGFTAEPFQLTADPRLFYRSSGHGKALAYLTYGISQAEGFIVVTGEVGAGKTTIIQYLLDHLDHDKYVAGQIVTTNLQGDDMILSIAAAFGLSVTNRQKSAVLRQIEQFLIDARKRGKRVILIVDECQNLSVEAVEELRMLSNFQLEQRPLLQSFLVGQPQFRAILSSPELEQLRQRVTASCHLGPMTEAETREYIEHRLRSVGWAARPAFAPDAFATIHRETDGIPRKINRLCSRLLLACCLDRIESIDVRLVTQTAADLGRELGAPPGTAPAMPVFHRQAHDGNGGMPAVALNGAASALEHRLHAAEARLDKVEAVSGRLIEASRGLLDKLRALPN